MEHLYRGGGHIFRQYFKRNYEDYKVDKTRWREHRENN